MHFTGLQITHFQAGRNCLNHFLPRCCFSSINYNAPHETKILIKHNLLVAVLEKAPATLINSHMLRKDLSNRKIRSPSHSGTLNGDHWTLFSKELHKASTKYSILVIIRLNCFCKCVYTRDPGGTPARCPDVQMHVKTSLMLYVMGKFNHNEHSVT